MHFEDGARITWPVEGLAQNEGRRQRDGYEQQLDRLQEKCRETVLSRTTLFPSLRQKAGEKITVNQSRILASHEGN